MGRRKKIESRILVKEKMIISDIQPTIWKKLLKIKANQRIGSAYVFTGFRGSGKEWASIQFAKLINCNELKDALCNNCNSCLQFNSLQHPNLKLIFPLPAGINSNKNKGPIDSLKKEEFDYITKSLELKSKDPFYKINVPKANRIPISCIRDLHKTIYLKTDSSNKKIVIIFDAHLLSQGMGESANALLKILEEPPKNTIFILVTDKKSALLPTIMSRCQEIAFPILDLDTIRIMLEEKGVKNQQAIELAMIVGGDFRQAIDLVNSNENFVLEIKNLVNQIINISENGWREFINNFSMLAYRNPEEFKFKFYLLQTWFHQAYRSRVGIYKSEDLEELKNSLNQFNKKYPNANLNEINKLLEESVYSLSRNLYTPLMLTNFLISLQKLLKGKELEPIL